MKFKILIILSTLIFLFFGVVLQVAAEGPTLVTHIPVGVGLYDVTVNPTTNHIYASMKTSEMVAVIDGSTNTVIDTVDLRIINPDGSWIVRTPEGIGVNPVTNKIYASNGFSNDVTVIDGFTNTILVDGIFGGGLDVAINHVTNRVYVAVTNGGSISVIDGISDTLLTSVPAGTGISGVTVDDAINKVYATNTSDHTITVIDGDTSSVIDTIILPDGSFPRGIAANYATNLIYVANEGSDTISIIDGLTDSVVTSIPQLGHMRYVAVNPLTNRIYVTNRETYSVSIIDGNANTMIADIFLGFGRSPEGIAINPLTNLVYVANSDVVSVIYDPPPIIVVEIDVRPGNDLNNTKIGNAGLIPVAILSSASFDATTVNPDTISLSGAKVRLVGKSDKYLCSEIDINSDSLVDLVCKIETDQVQLVDGQTTVILEGETYNGDIIRGEDTISIVPDS